MYSFSSSSSVSVGESMIRLPRWLSPKRILSGRVLGADDAALVEDQRPLHHVLELADVAGPVVLHHQLHRILVHRLGAGLFSLWRLRK